MASVATPPLPLSLSLCVSVYMFNTLLNMWPGPEILLMPVVIPSRVAQTQVGGGGEGEGVSHMQKSHKFSCLCARLILELFSHIFLNCCAQDISVCVWQCVCGLPPAFAICNRLLSLPLSCMSVHINPSAESARSAAPEIHTDTHTVHTLAHTHSGTHTCPAVRLSYEH